MLDAVVVDIAAIATQGTWGVLTIGGPRSRSDQPFIDGSDIAQTSTYERVGISARISAHQASLAVSVICESGHHPDDVVARVQHSVAAAIHGMTGLVVSDVEVRATPPLTLVPPHLSPAADTATSSSSAYTGAWNASVTRPVTAAGQVRDEVESEPHHVADPNQSTGIAALRIVGEENYPTQLR